MVRLSGGRGGGCKSRPRYSMDPSIVSLFRNVLSVLGTADTAFEYTAVLRFSLRIAKRLYYEKKLNNVQSNARVTWKVLNENLNRSERNSNDSH